MFRRYPGNSSYKTVVTSSAADACVRAATAAIQGRPWWHTIAAVCAAGVASGDVADHCRCCGSLEFHA